MDGISPAAAAYYNSLGVQKNTDWLASTVTAIKRSQNQAGIMGALANSGNRGTISSFLSQSKSFAGNFATIAQTNVSNSGSYYAKLANANRQKAAKEKLMKALSALSASQNKVKKKNVLPAFMYLGDGTSLDTANGILTRKDGTRINIATGAEVVDPSSIIQMGNGAYLNTQTNILTLSDGTKIDNITHQKVDTTA